MTLFEIVKKDRMKMNPEIKESSIKMYVSNIKKLSKFMNDGEFVEGIEWLKDFEKVKEILNENNLQCTSMRNYMNSAMIYLHCYDEHDLIKVYTDYRDQLNQKYEDQNASGTWSEKQGKNVITMDELNKLIQEIGTEIKFRKLKEKAILGQINTYDRSLVQLYMILSVHAILPMRNDLAMMKVIKKAEYNGLTDEQKKKTNYLVVERSNMFFVLNDYKTSRVYKEKIIELPQELRRLMRFYLQLLPTTEYLLTKQDGDPMTKNGLSQLLTKATQKRLGKSISTTMLRKIYLSEKYSPIKEEMEKDSHNMCHSMNTAMKYYVKTAEDKKIEEE
jgi:hypothetical protein